MLLDALANKRSEKGYTNNVASFYGHMKFKGPKQILINMLNICNGV